jgi:hypothetical protein
MPPPIVSRIYQELSNGSLGFHQAQKIAKVPFPFPYAQLLAIMKVYFILTVPLAIVCFTDDYAFAVLMSGFCTSIFVCLNEVAIELEDPFGNDANYLPLRNMHASFNKALEHLLHQEAPESDHVKSAKYMKLQSSIKATLRRVTAGQGKRGTPGAAAAAPSTPVPGTTPDSPQDGGAAATGSAADAAPANPFRALAAIAKQQQAAEEGGATAPPRPPPKAKSGFAALVSVTSSAAAASSSSEPSQAHDLG